MKITVKIDPTACILAANCVGVTTQFFRIADEPHVELLDRQGAIKGTQEHYDATPEELELLHEAEDACPTRAIEVIEN